MCAKILMVVNQKEAISLFGTFDLISSRNLKKRFMKITLHTVSYIKTTILDAELQSKF